VGAALTRAGSVVGTPLYMAPEQLRGGRADAKSDQFSFCVALYEALFGVRPFAGASVGELLASIEAGAVRAPAAGARAPRWLWRAVRLGLEARPERRHASMGALLAELGRERGRRWRQAAAGAGALLLAGLAAAGAHWRSDRRLLCRGAERHLAGVWDEERRGRVLGALRATGVPYAEAAAREVGRALDGYAAGWAAQHEAACEATRVRGEQTEEVLGLRMACLEERRREVRAVSEWLLGADAKAAEQAAQAVHRLSPLEGCADVGALSGPVRAPGGEAGAEVERQRGRVAELRAARLAGRFREVLAGAGEVAEAARRLHYRPLEAEALFLKGQCHEALGDHAGAERAFDEAALAAEAGRHDELLARALTEALDVEDPSAAHDARIERRLPRVRAVLERLGHPEAFEGRLSVALGRWDMERGRYAEAEASLRRALELFESKWGPEHPRLIDVHVALSQVAGFRREPAAMRAEALRAYAMMRNVRDEETTDAAICLYALAYANFLERRYDEAALGFERVLAIYERGFGPEDPRAADVLDDLARSRLAQGRAAEAVANARRAASIHRNASGPGHVRTAAMLATLAAALEAAGEPDEAARAAESALDVFSREVEANGTQVADALLTLGRAEARRGRFAEARRAIERSHALRPALPKPGDGEGETLQALGAVELRAGRADRAVGPLERALAAHARDGDDPLLAARTRALLARALWPGGRERARALLAEARALFAAEPAAATDLAELDRWRHEHNLP
jgi:tetratricopeptide (TPR) repeat protein